MVLPTSMHSLGRAALVFGLMAASGVSALAQGFAFTNGTLAAANCKAASDGERTQAIALAQAALPRFPHPMPHVHVEGLLPHQGARDESLLAEQDWTAARDLAVGYCVTGQQIYLDHADTILAAWLKEYQPNFNPVDETNLEQLFLAADILDSAMPAPLFAQWQAFAGRLSAGYLEQIDKHVTTADHRQSLRLKLATMGAYLVADAGAIGHAESAFTTQLGANINSEGDVTDFAKHDALRYAVYDLEPLVIAGLAAHDHGENWYGITASNGSTLASALQWLSPYATGAQTNQEFQNSGVPFDAARRDAGVAGYAGQWQPQGSALLYLYASALDRQWGELAFKLGGTPKLWQRLEMGMS